MSDIITKIDKLLEDDSNFTTRTGLRFMTTVLKEAIEVIQNDTSAAASANHRLTIMEKEFRQFLDMQAAKDKKADEERTKWRWAILAPLIAMAISQIIQWISR